MSPVPKARATFLAIDPGLHTGWSYWGKEGGKAPELTGQFNVVRGLPREEVGARIGSLLTPFETLLVELRPRLVFVEGVELWGGSAKSNAAAQQGNTMLLAYIVGAYISACQRERIRVEVVLPSQWKGQLDNAVALPNRVFRATGMRFETEHIMCAVGLGLAKMGVL